MQVLKIWKNSLAAGADTANANTFDAAPQHSPTFAQHGDFLKNYGLMIETGRDRSFGRRLQTFDLPLPNGFIEQHQLL